MGLLAMFVVLLVFLGSLLAMAEASASRMTKAKAAALRASGHRNAALLEQIESDPAPYLNSIYLVVMGVQNGSAILVAMLAEHEFGDVGIAIVSALFTIVYFVIVEAMSKTFGILHSATVALALAPLVWFLGRMLRRPTALLVRLANVLVPGKGLEQGPFVVEQEIRSLAESAHAEGALATEEKDLIHAVFAFGDTRVRQILVPRPDIIAIDATRSIRDLEELVVRHGISRVPVYRGDLDHVEGIVYAKDVARVPYERRGTTPASELSRPPYFVPEGKRAADLLRDMRQQKCHITIVVDEYGSVVGLVTLEDLVEELVGDIADEHETDEAPLLRLDDGRYRASGRLSIADVNAKLGTHLPDDESTTVGGLLLRRLGTIPKPGDEIGCDGVRIRVEQTHGPRVESVVISVAPPAAMRAQ